MLTYTAPLHLSHARKTWQELQQSVIFSSWVLTS